MGGAGLQGRDDEALLDPTEYLTAGANGQAAGSAAFMCKLPAASRCHEQRWNLKHHARGGPKGVSVASTEGPGQSPTAAKSRDHHPWVVSSAYLLHVPAPQWPLDLHSVFMVPSWRTPFPYLLTTPPLQPLAGRFLALPLNSQSMSLFLPALEIRRQRV